MLARGNNEAALRLRRAKSTSSVVKAHSHLQGFNADIDSTYNNAKTAATKAFQTAHELVSKRPKSTITTPKRQRGGAGSHFAQQKSHEIQRFQELEKASRPARYQCSKSESSVSPCVLPEMRPATPSRTKLFLSEGHSDCNSSPNNPPSPFPTPDKNIKRLHPPKWELLQPLKAKSRKCSLKNSNLHIASALGDNATSHPCNGLVDHIDVDQLFNSLSEEEGSLEQDSSRQIPSTYVHQPRSLQSNIWSRLKIRSKSLGNSFANRPKDHANDIANKKIRRVPSSLKALKDTYKRKVRKESCTTNPSSRIPTQQVEARQSHHFGSRRLNTSIGARNSCDKQSATFTDEEPPTPPPHIHPILDSDFPAENDHVLENLDGTSFGNSRLSSWANTSGYTTMARQKTCPNTGISNPRIPASSSHTLNPIYALPEESTFLKKESKVNRRRIYSALIKRISESETSGMETEQNLGNGVVSEPLSDEQHATIKHNPKFFVSEKPEDNYLHSALLNSTATDDGLENVFRERASNASPSVYSPYPWTNLLRSQQSNVSMAGDTHGPTGTAFISPSEHFTRWSLQPTASHDAEDRPLTSGDWRDWASTKMSGLDGFTSQPPSIHIRAPPDATTNSSEVRPAQNGLCDGQRRDSLEHGTFDELGAAGRLNEERAEDWLRTTRASHQRTQILRRMSSAGAIGQARLGKAFAFAKRPSSHLKSNGRKGSNSKLAPLNELSPSMGNARVPSSARTVVTKLDSNVGENAPPVRQASSRSKTPEWIPPPPPNHPFHELHRLCEDNNSPQKPASVMSERFLHEIRRGPYAESMASTSSAHSNAVSARKKAGVPSDLAQLRIRRTRRRKRDDENISLRQSQDGKDMVDEFLRCKTGALRVDENQDNDTALL